MAKITITSKQLERRFGKLAEVPRTRGVEQGFLDGANHIKDRAEGEAPVKDGFLRRGMRADLLPGKVIGSYAGSTAPHSHLIERGTVERFHKNGKSVGRINPPDPFFSRAIAKGRRKARQFITDAIAAEVRRASNG